jgi:hypothetical protein
MRALLLILIGIAGLVSIVFGILMMMNQDGSALQLNRALLEPTFFKSFLVPGMIFFVIGIVNIAAVFAIMRGSRSWYAWSLAGGAAISVWITSAILMMQLIHWIQFVYLIGGILIILVAFQLKGKWAA